MQKMTPHYTADALSIKPTEGPWQTGSLQPASKFRTKECLIASATSCLYHYKAILVISIKMISNDNSKPQQQPHGGIPEKLAWSLGAMSERHWSKLKLAILSAGSRLPNIPYGPQIFDIPRAWKCLTSDLCAFVPAWLYSDCSRHWKGWITVSVLRGISTQYPTDVLLTLILWTRGAKRNTKSSTVAMEFWKNFLLLFSSSSFVALGRGCPGDPWFSAWWIKALPLPPQLEPLSPPKRSLLQSWGASSSIQWRVWSSFVSATPSLSWCPGWEKYVTVSHRLSTNGTVENFRGILGIQPPS